MTVRSIMRPEPLVPYSSFALVGAANVLTAEPKEVAVTSGGFPSFYADAGAPIAVDTFVLGYVAKAGADLSGFTVNFFAGGLGGAPQVGQAALLPTALRAGRRHCVLQLGAPVAERIVGFYIGGPGADAAGLQIGLFAVGRSFRPAWGSEYGSGAGVIDTGSVTRRRDGGFGIDPGARAATLQWTFGDLSDAETDALFALLMDRGETASIVAIEGADTGPTTSEQVHWGRFTRIETYERLDAGITRWSLRMEDWA